MTTILEYVIEKLYCKPTGHGSDPGVSYWHCPKCGHDSFHTLPDVPDEKHRTRCYNPNCGMKLMFDGYPGGDVFDMLKIFMPSGPPNFFDFRDRKARLAELESEWRKLEQKENRLGCERGVHKPMTPKDFGQRKRLREKREKRKVDNRPLTEDDIFGIDWRWSLRNKPVRIRDGDR